VAALAVYAAAGAMAVAAAHFLAPASLQMMAAWYFIGLWVGVLLLLATALRPAGRGGQPDDGPRFVLWGITAGGAVFLAVVFAVWRDYFFGALLVYLFVYMLVLFYITAFGSAPEEWLEKLKALSTGIAFAANAAAVCWHFSPFSAVLAGLALFVIGILVGTMMTFPGASFVIGLGMFTLLSTGLGYALGGIFGSTGLLVAGAFGLSLFLGLALPPLPDFPRALLAVLSTAAAGTAGAVLGYGLGAPLPGALAFLALGAYLSMTLGEERSISLALFSVLASMLMGLGHAAAYCTGALVAGSAPYWVGGLFGLSAAIYVFSRAPRVRLALLLVAPVALLVGLGFAAGWAFGQARWAMAPLFFLSLAFDLWIYFASDSRVMGQNDAWVVAEEDCPRAYAMTRRLSAAAGVPAPRIALVGSDSPNLFTVGRSPSRAVIAVTQGLLDGLDDDELEAVLAHELVHVRENDLTTMTMAAALASPVGAIARALHLERGKGQNLLMLLAVGAAAPFFALMVQLSNPRSRERAADAGALKLIKNRQALADALEKLELGAVGEPLPANPATGPLFAVNPFRAGWLDAMFSTHPATGERVAVLRQAAPAGG
jgi:heat shock protein HtpX